MIYGYARVSTKTQARDGSSLEAQEAALRSAGAMEIYQDARSFSDGSEIVNRLIARGVRVHILNIGVMDSTPSSKLIRNIFFAFAEFERDMIVERTTEGRALARQREGYREGRPPKYDADQVAHALELLKNHSYSQVSKLTGISRSTLIRAQKRRTACQERDPHV